MDTAEVHQGKDCLDVLVQEHHLVLTEHVHQVSGLTPLVIQDHQFLHGHRILVSEEVFILHAADLLHHSAREVHLDVMPGDAIPLPEEGVNHAQYLVLLEDLHTLLGLPP
jgi:hypothetical protein